ncbi:MAG: PKD domain-containing protein, partial [Chloroflexaceae bacterium]|nr:PKD domain-containing protein [Chloroflexaceae bacterium]
DKGTGMGVYDLASRTVNLIDGTRTLATEAGKDSNFTPIIEGESYLIDLPNRLAFKHAHSRQNPEADWGTNVLQSIEFAFYVLNLPENFGLIVGGIAVSTVTPENTTVIAASVSNGAAASVRAAEQDTEGLIDGIAVSEPNTNPQMTVPMTITQNGRSWSGENVGRPLIDYYTYLNLYQACANVATANAAAPLNLVSPELGANRCQSLRDAGLLESDTLAEQAAEAQQKINDYGILVEQNLLMPFHYFANTVESISVLYTNSYGRFGVEDNICGFSYAQIDATGVPITATQALLAAQFSDSNGIPPSAGVALINDNAQGGPSENRNSVSSNGVRDQNLPGALCLRRLYTGEDIDGNPLTGAELALHEQVVEGVEAIKVTGDLQDIPMVIVNGRNDAVLAPNHASRAYYALNRAVNSDNTVRYYEILNAHHLDAFNDLAGYNASFIPLHHYYFQALDLMYEHLTSSVALPPSQVVPTTPRGLTSVGTVPPITRANVPPIADNPVDAVLITTEGGTDGITLNVPDLATLPLSVAADDPTPLGSATNLTATLNVDVTYASYTWDLGDGTIIENEPAGTLEYTYAAPGVYTVGVTATTSSGLAFGSTVVEVDEVLTGLTAENSGPTSLGSATAFSATLETGSNATFVWSFGDGGTATGPNPTYTYANTGTYTATVTARNATGTLTAETVVTVEDAPIVGLTAENSSPNLFGQTTDFTATISTGSNVTYTWDFGDGNNSPATTGYQAVLSGDNEVPPITTEASGLTTFDYDPATRELSYVINVENIDNVVAAHIHRGFAGTNGPVIYWLFDPSGVQAPGGTLAPGSPISGTITIDEATAATLQTDGLYVNVHSTDFPMGEVRGQIFATGQASYTYEDVGTYTAMVTATNNVSTVVATTTVEIVASIGSGLVTPENGGAISIGEGDAAIIVIFPPGVVAEPVTISLTRELSPSVAFDGTVLRVLIITALDSEGNVIDNLELNGDYTIRFRYSDAQLSDLDLTEANLQAFVLQDGTYVEIPPATALATTAVDPSANLVTVLADRSGEFLVGTAQAGGGATTVYLPIVIRGTTE